MPRNEVLQTMDESGQLAMVMTTVANQEDADRLAQALVDQCLAACVQIDGPVTSCYRWAGEVQKTNEFRLIIKTSCKAWPPLKEKMTKLHPYDEPELILFNIDDASDGYRAWVNDQTS
jgi:periplasmic divalent cation tolerance protein